MGDLSMDPPPATLHAAGRCRWRCRSHRAPAVHAGDERNGSTAAAALGHWQGLDHSCPIVRWLHTGHFLLSFSFTQMMVSIIETCICKMRTRTITLCLSFSDLPVKTGSTAFFFACVDSKTQGARRARPRPPPPLAPKDYPWPSRSNRRAKWPATPATEPHSATRCPVSR